MNKKLFKKLLLLTALLCGTALSVVAQYGNEWINPSQTYFKIKVGTNGIYKIDYDALSAAGLPVSSINPVNFQLFQHGVEQDIYVAGENDNSFDNGDFIEFYGKYNDGEDEADMYRTPEEQPHKYISLWSDTSNYYLTWTTSTPGKRLTDYSNNNYSGKTSDSWFWYSSYYFSPRDYYDGSPYSDPGYHSEFTQGEGWFTDYAFNTRAPVLNVPTPAYNSSGPAPECTFGVYGISNPTESVNNINHKVEVHIGTNLIYEKFFSGYSRVEPGFNDPKVNLNSSLITSSVTPVKFSSTYLSRGRMAITHARIDYPRSLDMDNSSYFEFDYTGSNDYFSFSNYSGSAPFIYDFENKRRIPGDLSGTTLRFNCPAVGSKKLVIADQSSLTEISSSNIEKVDYSNSIKTINEDYDYIILTNKKLTASASEYKAYRESAEGGSHKAIIVYASDVYNEFYHGIHHPKAVRNFCKYLFENQSIPPEHILLLGKGQSLELTRFDDSRRKNEDLVPTWGMPPSDYFFVTDFSGVDLAPAIPIGRVPARTDQEVRNYLSKLKTYEQFNNPNKEILYLTGGTGIAQQNDLKWRQEQYYKIAEAPQFGGNGTFINKVDAEAIDGSLTEVIQDEINAGVSMVGYFGHGASQTLELDMGDVNDLENEGKYPLFLFNGCALANTFGDISLPEKFLLHESKGGVAWIATSAYGFIDPLYKWTTSFYTNAYDKNYGKSIGKIIQATHQDYQKPTDNFNRSQCRQMLYHGDPALKLYSPIAPDYQITEFNRNDDIIPKDYNAELDSFALRIQLRNEGLATTDTPSVYVTVKYSNDSTASFGPRKYTHVFNN